jgi:hypothetical protein
MLTRRLHNGQLAFDKCSNLERSLSTKQNKLLMAALTAKINAPLVQHVMLASM